jgi:hypothetical protein
MENVAKLFSVVIALALTVILGAPETNATVFSYSGNFTQDDNVMLFNFSLLSNSSVNISTSSYAAGGFDPTLTLFDSTGVFIDQNQDISSIDNFDSFMSDTLLAGSYIVALTQYDNFPIADDINNKLLSDGFTQQGAGNFTGPEFLLPGAPGSFINIDGLQRTSQWAVNIEVLDAANNPATVPEPSTLLLLAAGFAGMCALQRLRRQPQTA